MLLRSDLPWDLAAGILEDEASRGELRLALVERVLKPWRPSRARIPGVDIERRSRDSALEEYGESDY